MIYEWTEALASRDSEFEEIEYTPQRKEPEPQPETQPEIQSSSPAPEPVSDTVRESLLTRFSAMSKQQMDAYAMEELGVNLDRRKSAQTLLNELVDAAIEQGVR